MAPGLTLWGHIAVGFLAILFFWATLLSSKGSPRHRAWGKRFFVTLVIVAASIAPLLLLRSGSFNPAWLIQFIYLALCLLTVTLIGWTSIRWKNDLPRFRGRHFKILAVTIFLLGAVVLIAGMLTQNILTASFSWVGLAYGGTMIRFGWMKAQPHPRWWMIWHLNAVCGLFNAVHGTFLAVIWRTLVDSTAGIELGATMQVVTVLAALGLRLWWGTERNAPLRLTNSMSAAVKPA
jgi:hypothetical protein